MMVDLMAVAFVDDSVTLLMDNKNHFDVFVVTTHPEKGKKKNSQSDKLEHLM